MRRFLLVAGASFGLATSAQALEPKQCLSLAEINAALKAAGQRTMVLGDRLALRNPTGKVEDASVKRYANALTSNQDGSEGYLLEGDLPRSQASTRMCVGARLTNVRLYDNARPGVPPELLLGGKFSDFVTENEKGGVRPIAFAETVHRDQHGRWQPGGPMLMLGRQGGGANLVTRTPNGDPERLAVMGGVEYTPAARERLGRGS